MRVGVVGGGTVGRALARSYLEWAEVRVFDVRPERATHALDDALAADLVFLCLPTPEAPGGGGLDTSAVEDFCQMLGGAAPAGHYVLRSTVPVGTTRRLAGEHGLAGLVHSPEFLTARCAAADAQLPARNVVGGSGPCADALEALYRRRFPGVPVLRMSRDESEAVKLVTNGFFAVKVAFWNEARGLCDALGLGWEAVLAGALADGRISHSHTRVPGPDGRRGFGGACLPKDLGELAAALARAGLPPHVCAAALARNRADRGEGAG